MSIDEMMLGKRSGWMIAAIALGALQPCVLAQTSGGAPLVPSSSRSPIAQSNYVLGSKDQLRIWALGVPELSTAPFRVDDTGNVDLPMIGTIRVAGLSLDQVKLELTTRLKTYVKEPDVTVSLAEYGSQPVSVIGAVNSPGVHQLQGSKTLVEVLSQAGGLRPEAGYSVKITRQLQYGEVPLANAKTDESGKYSTAEVNLKGLLDASDPNSNIKVQPNDVISVPRGQMVYVIGQVRKPGGFVLNERESLSVLQALSMAEGLDRTASPKNARILRAAGPNSQRQEIDVNLSKILSADSKDQPMQADDILFVPNNVPKAASLRALEAAIQIGTGIVIWRR